MAQTNNNSNNNTNDQPLTQEQLNFAIEFAKSLNNFSPLLGGFFNPLMANQYLKNLNMNPVQQNRDNVKNMINNPQHNEKSLRRLSQHLYYSQMSYKRMVHYLSDILTFDWYPVPINATESDMKKSTFKKDYEKMCEWFDRFNVKKEFKKAMLKMTLEDGYFVYMREDSDNDLFLQEMPIDFCMVDDAWKYGYLYAFDLMYFKQMGVDINGFPKEFKTYYSNALDMQKNNTYHPGIKAEMRNGQWMFWQQIKPKNGWVFKFHNHFAGLIPPFLGVFLDFIDIPMLKELFNSKSELEAYKIIMGTVPRNKDNKSGSRSDDFAIEADTLGNFVQLVKNSIQNKYVDFKAVPLEGLEMFDFEEKANKEDSLKKAFNNLSTQTGIDKSLMNTDKPNVAVMKMSKLVDEVFISRLYDQFSDFATYHANLETNKYKFKIKMMGTIHDREERQERAKNDMTTGFFTPRIAADQGMTLKEMERGMALMGWLGIVDKLTPAQTSYTLSGKDVENKGGREKGKLETESAEITETHGSNDNRILD